MNAGQRTHCCHSQRLVDHPCDAAGKLRKRLRRSEPASDYRLRNWCIGQGRARRGLRVSSVHDDLFGLC